MKSIVLALFCCLAAPVLADSFHSDAFGVVPIADLSDARSAWRDVAGPATTTTTPVDAVLIFAGPKSLTAGKDDLHVVALAVDAFGNLAPDGLPAEFRVGDRRIGELRTDAGIAELRVRPEPSEGSYISSASIQDRQSARATYRVTADVSSMTPQLETFETPMQIETFNTVTTAEFTDKFGNAAADGMGAQILLRHQDNAVTVLPSVTLNARAIARVLTRDLPGGGAVQVTLSEQRSPLEVLELDRISATAPPKLRLTPVPEINAIKVRVGPLETDAGHYLNDGALIQIVLRDKTDQSFLVDGWVFNGHFETTFPVAPDTGPFQISVETALGRFETSLWPDITSTTASLGGSE